MKKILVINGPNLNLLGDREPEIYGIKTLKDIENECLNEFKELELVFCQSNSESEIIEYIHSASKFTACLLYTSPSPRDKRQPRMPSSA